VEVCAKVHMRARPASLSGRTYQLRFVRSDG